MSPSYTCFLHPKSGRAFKSLDETCPECGRPFHWPMSQRPARVGNYLIDAAKGRGFYGVTYLAHRGLLSAPRILKVVPANTYDVFNKRPWLDECNAHNELATQHQVHFARIMDCGTDEVVFADGAVIDCHWAELDYIDGPTLEDYIKEEGGNVRAAAQIVIDLLEILRVLSVKQVFHNDLHANNILIARLGPGERRAEPPALDGSVRAVAIDFGSLAEHAIADRPTDRERVGEILQQFTDKLQAGDPARTDSNDYRLAAELTKLRDLFASPAENTRQPGNAEMVEIVRRAVEVADDADWSGSDQLLTISEGYNAQTLRPSTVARLLVDDDSWTSEIASGGAQLVLGMRGCGKTMLLRSLDFHARIALALGDSNEPPIAQVRDSQFVGLYVSGSRLLDARRNKTIDFRPILFAAYAREASRVLRHLVALGTAIDPQAASYIARVVRTYLAGSDGAVPETPTPVALDHALQQLLSALASGQVHHPLLASATTAFQDLATALVRATGEWGSVRVLYLLDDISTRYLDENLIRDVLAEVLFQSPICAFKVTTETQTWVSVLRSPGNVETIREDRDYKRFELGERVARRLSDEGWKFIDKLLQKRLTATDRGRRLMGVSPAQILGHHALEKIAQSIASTSTSAASRKEVYYGIEALTAICVGDIGDTITLFERMLERSESPGSGVSAKSQTEVYRQFCGQRLWELSSRDVDLKNYALGFAEAAYELLRSSGRKKKEQSESRLRQYTKLYVRDLTKDGFARVRKLIDAGVFVVEGGVPRSKTKDFDVLTNFVLVFRKVLGISSYIGLSDRDRFELSGAPLSEWLASPAAQKDMLRDILIRNQDTEHREDGEIIEDSAAAAVIDGPPVLQPNFFNIEEPETSSAPQLAEALLPRLMVNGLPTLEGIHFGIILSGLGFEERAAVSTTRIVAAATIDRAIVVRYPDHLGNPTISDHYRSHSIPVDEITDYQAIDFGPGHSKVLIDVTGLKTTYLWEAVRRALSTRREVWIAYTNAQKYSPSNDQVAAVRQESGDEADSNNLDKLRALVSGESHVYRFMPLLPTRDDIMRPLALIAAASPKMMRLEYLIESRSFDRLTLFASNGTSARAWLSNVAARAVASSIPDSVVQQVSTTDLVSNVNELERQYRSLFVDTGMDVALGLTGSKIQAVAMAALSMSAKISEAWYVEPSSYDAATFTLGADRTVFFRVGLPSVASNGNANGVEAERLHVGSQG